MFNFFKKKPLPQINPCPVCGAKPKKLTINPYGVKYAQILCNKCKYNVVKPKILKAINVWNKQKK